MSSRSTAACPNCKSNNTVRIGQLIGTWLHFCFGCGRRFEIKAEDELAWG